MKSIGLKMTESLVQGKLARRVRWGGCRNVRSERDEARCVLTQSLSERKDAYRMAGKSISYYEQKRDLPEIKTEIREEYQDIHSQVLQDVLLRLKKAFDNFFRRVKNGEEPGYPRFQGRNRYNSFTYPQGGYSLTHDSRVCLSKIGSIKAKFHREIEGTIKTATIKHEAGQWYIIFSCEIEQPKPLPVVASEVGIDMGVTHFAALSDGTFIESPRYYRKSQKKLEKLQHVLSHKKRGSHRRNKARQAVAKAHRKIANQRRDFHHKQAAKSGLNKSILDAGWGQFQQIVVSKAAYAGRTVLKVNPRYTSQVCSQCGTVRKKVLSERWHSCECGCELDRDTNAAVNILRLGSNQRGATCVEAPNF